jgi:protein-S-isoprenylcysteine O-methyltransferase Ste14
MTRMPLQLLSYVVTTVPQFAPPASIDAPSLVAAMLPWAYAPVGLLYYGYLLLARRSPILGFWQLISYDRPAQFAPPTWRQGVVLWAQHLIIAYAFAVTLVGFLQSNIDGIREVGWPPASPEAAVDLLNLILWMLTVAGCLIGYGYSVVSILWGKHIRNLDFTVTGWLTNGFCYYPLFGAVIAQLVPSYVGVDPVVTGGPIYVVVPLLALFFNLLYTLSIFNLGTMFDLMSDKGVRSSGFYSLVRHPNYTLEVGMLLLVDLGGVTGRAEVFSVLVSTIFLYWIRSEREDNFMAYSNPEYAEYQNKTPYKFIPGIY